MPRTFFISVVITLLMLTASVTQADDKETKLRRLLAQSNFTEQIYQFPNVMKSSISQIHEMGHCNQEELNTISQAIELTIKPKYLNDILLKDLSDKISDKQVDKILTWYNSPLGLKVSKQELKASNPGSYAEMKSMSEKLFQNNERVELAREIDKVMNATDWAVNIEMQSKIAMFSALAQIQHKNITETLMQLASQLEQQKIETRPQVQESIALWYLFAFRDLTNDELKSYISFLRNKDTATYNKTALNSLAYAITRVTENFLVVIEGLSNTTDKE